MSNQLAKPDDRVKSLLSSQAVKSRFDEMLGRKAPAFISSILSAVNSNKALREAEPMSIISAAAIAASMDLPINPSLGFAHIVPYGQHAQFQLGWKGYIQLAMRSGQYKTINLTPVLEGQIKSHNQFTGEMEFHAESTSDKQIGYLLYFKLLNGYEKYFYMTVEQCTAHGKKYSKSFANNRGMWADGFEAMALKTVAKQGLSRYGILSLDMQKAFEVDQAAISEDGSPNYVDGTREVKETNEEPVKSKAKAKPNKLAAAIAEQTAVKNYAPQSETQVEAPSELTL